MSPLQQYRSMINLIDQQAQVNSELSAFPNASITISIFGTQASGKSTILNCAFGTQFPVLDTSKSRGRCTKGVWFQNVNSKIIVDTQGFDSNQRTAEEKIFEKQLSLFCVVLSDVIIVNMYMYQIGRYSGGHLDILQSIFKVGERLVTPQKKKIIFVIRDCSQDAEKKVLQGELQKSINKIVKKNDNKMLKCTFDFVFMSHYVYQPQKFKQEVSVLSTMAFKSKSTFSNYKEAQRLLYVKQLWSRIKSFETEIDLKSIDDALKTHVFERLKQDILTNLHKELAHYSTLNEAKTYARYIDALKKISLDYYGEHRPKHIKEQEVEAYSNKVFDIFEPEAVKHFNETLLVNIENELQSELNNQIERNKNSKKLSSTIFKKKKQVVQLYKKIVNGHKQTTLLIKRFNERIGQIMAREQNKFSHLFSIFQITVEKQLNLQMDKQVNTLTFNKDTINRKIKSLCQEYQYNEWEVNFTQIWDRVTFRCMDKVIPQNIEEKSAKVREGILTLSGNQTTNIIAYHTRMQKKIILFCREILQFMHEEGTLSQPLSRIKDCVRQNLAKRLNEENRRFKISLLIISILLLLLYGEIAIFFGWILKKKTKKLLLRIYWYGALVLLIGSLYREYRGTGNALVADKESQQNK